MLYTRRGDDGTSGLFDTQERFSKDSPVYHALGTLDELNSLLGLCRARVSAAESRGLDIAAMVLRAQEHIFIAQAQLAGASKSMTRPHVEELERMIDATENYITKPGAFVIPGATELSGLFDYARAVCRRAERTIIATPTVRGTTPEMRAYFNRLSSFLYALARYSATMKNVQEPSPLYL